ncbi:pyridoxal-phosphate dependent enzyme [Streptomyces sp. NBC_00083]|uniref:pyridoxal-phosphate dependent enzyme n=1 Tax=Streptomyces sp. NBC_00083 TaxID=2975647 RepID=UPI002251499E|nr:pyridoxal-phosphate dependent enzyme [Streptomyces sp. NBC_00083]MCX5387441.1 pyridoxal-phosphate dependent enzyme [Streptomyces sp. NBC_00083]
MQIYAQDDVVWRYAAHLSAGRREIRRASLLESGRIVRLPPQGGVFTDVLDLSTANATGTFKSWLICLAVARCLRQEQPLVLAQSSGNTANALAAYAAHTGLRAVILHPPASRRRIVPRLAESGAVQFVEVDAPEQRIKAILATCAETLALPVVPHPADQDEANKLRAYFLHDAATELGTRWDWHVQALSSGYGPLGYYAGLRELRGRTRSVPVPRFLGVQQEAVTPYVRALSGETTGSRGGSDGAEASGVPVLEPTLFRQSLTEDLVRRMRELCAYSHGTVRALTNSRYLQLEPHAADLLREAGIAVALEPDGTPRERAGLYSLAGTLDAIEHGVIRPGERALAVFTGGAAPSPGGTYEPHWRAHQDEACDIVARAVDKLRP